MRKCGPGSVQVRMFQRVKCEMKIAGFLCGVGVWVVGVWIGVRMIFFIRIKLCFCVHTCADLYLCILPPDWLNWPVNEAALAQVLLQYCSRSSNRSRMWGRSCCSSPPAVYRPTPTARVPGQDSASCIG